MDEISAASLPCNDAEPIDALTKPLNSQCVELERHTELPCTSGLHLSASSRPLSPPPPYSSSSPLASPSAPLKSPSTSRALRKKSRSGSQGRCSMDRKSSGVSGYNGVSEHYEEVHDEKHGLLHYAIPIMPLPLAAVLCVLNIVAPGIGKFLYSSFSHPLSLCFPLVNDVANLQHGP